MTVKGEIGGASIGATGADEFGIAVRDLLNELVLEPWGQSSPSVYETGRLVTIAPWLTGHAERIEYLLATQRRDGGWGAPGGYALVPTLSATEALLACLRRGRPGEAGMGTFRLVAAAERGLQLLFDLLADRTLAIPDMPAIDLTVPGLVAAVNEHLDAVGAHAGPVLVAGRQSRRLTLPPAVDGRRLTAIRGALATGVRVPEKLWHALEVVGDLAREARGVTLVPPGTIGGSPAATAAWLGGPRPDSHGQPALTYLREAVRRHSGPVPCATPLTVFERAWVLGALARAGIDLTVPPELVQSLRAAGTAGGTAAGPGLPADADTTSVALYAMGRLGMSVEPASLWPFDTGTHFSTWPGEDGYSITTNAHVLDALGQYASREPGAAPRYRAAAARLSAWLSEHQDADGAWWDRWHASPYYATSCCVLALHDYGDGPAADRAVGRAVDWVVATQRSDGSWGRWGGTTEETAYALQVLLTADPPTRPGAVHAAVAGLAYLEASAGKQLDPPLWHDKDLYRPTAIVRSAVLSVLARARRQLGVVPPTK
ncbi:prenyltransferase/squalene oxidase repeat-containing protein [Micromonospora sp. NPDC049559]|uniref:prenyltransferase/squalene oxidase repeat-containing protein n=1 Tax=Micromonospora sp. NPDC049559 TaxID=3155923 RepID=UPI0034224DB7